jgi:hypothetical protein
MPLTHPLEIALAIIGAALLVISEARGVLVHKENDNKRYRQFAGFSILVIAVLALASWTERGPLAAIAVIWLGRRGSLRILAHYVSLNEGEAAQPLDTSFTALLRAMSATLALAVVLLAALNMM